MANILVIEDDYAVRMCITEMLQADGFAVESAMNGEMGVQAAQKSQPDLIICDVMMPVMDGFTVVDTLRHTPATATTPIVMLTARAQRADMRRGMELGADDYITKPFTLEEVRRAVRAQIQKQTVLAQEQDTSLSLLRKNIIYALPHELRTPLTNILGYSRIIAEDAGKVPPQEIVEMATTIIENGERLNRMLENYLVYAQLELIASDEGELKALTNYITGNVQDLIRQEAEYIAAQNQRADDLEVRVEKMALMISEKNLLKIVVELVDNAFKFSAPGSPVRVCALRNGQFYEICVSDQGRGMSAEQVKRIGAYMQFERLLHEQQGLGLGLTIAKRIAELHGGSFEIQSVLDSSTTVFVRLPL